MTQYECGAGNNERMQIVVATVDKVPILELRPNSQIQSLLKPETIDLKIGFITSQRPESWQQTELANVTIGSLKSAFIISCKPLKVFRGCPILKTKKPSVCIASYEMSQTDRLYIDSSLAEPLPWRIETTPKKSILVAISSYC
jgi:hypothetical protein